MGTQQKLFKVVVPGMGLSCMQAALKFARQLMLVQPETCHLETSCLLAYAGQLAGDVGCVVGFAPMLRFRDKMESEALRLASLLDGAHMLGQCSRACLCGLSTARRLSKSPRVQPCTIRSQARLPLNEIGADVWLTCRAYDNGDFGNLSEPASASLSLRLFAEVRLSRPLT